MFKLAEITFSEHPRKYEPVPWVIEGVIQDALVIPGLVPVVGDKLLLCILQGVGLYPDPAALEKLAA